MVGVRHIEIKTENVGNGNFPSKSILMDSINEVSAKQFSIFYFFSTEQMTPLHPSLTFHLIFASVAAGLNNCIAVTSIKDYYRKNLMSSRGPHLFLFTHGLRDPERLNSPFSPIAFEPRGRLIKMNVKTYTWIFENRVSKNIYSFYYLANLKQQNSFKG